MYPVEQAEEKLNAVQLKYNSLAKNQRHVISEYKGGKIREGCRINKILLIRLYGCVLVCC